MDTNGLDQVTNSQQGSIDKAVSGDYEFAIGATISEAWRLTKGAKWPLLAATLWYMLILFGLTIFSELANLNIAKIVQDPTWVMVFLVLQQVVITAVLLPIGVGIAILGIKRAVNAELESTSVLDYFNKTLSLVFATLIGYIMVSLGFLLLILPGIYLAVAYWMAMPLIVEKNMGPWQALETSRKAISKRWFSFFFLGLVLGLIIMLSSIPLGLGMIWTVPLAIIAFGVVYRNMFGVETATQQTYI